MKNSIQINDLTTKALSWKQGRLTVTTESDPLLRRFGQLDYIILTEGESFEFERNQADEIWAAVSGAVAVELKDVRQDSPSFEVSQVILLDGEDPKALLVPFGVRCRINASTAAVLIRLATHQDNSGDAGLV